jgi:hypothetical protein
MTAPTPVTPTRSSSDTSPIVQAVTGSAALSSTTSTGRRDRGPYVEPLLDAVLLEPLHLGEPQLRREAHRAVVGGLRAENSSMNAARSRASGSRSTSRSVLTGAGGQATGPSSVTVRNLSHVRPSRSLGRPTAAAASDPSARGQRCGRVVHLHVEGRVRAPAPVRHPGAGANQGRDLDRGLLQHHRRHSANDGLAPIPFEHQMGQARAASAAQVRADVA